MTLVLAAFAALLAGPAGARTSVTVLHGTVGPGFTIKLTRSGHSVTRLQPGVYRIVVSDRSPMHNFVLEQSGGGTEKQITSVSFSGTKTVTMRLTRGQWEFYCRPHESTMKGHFGVGVAAKDDDAGDDHGGGNDG
jgi:plastocyanin